MPSYQIYIPGARGADPAQLAKVGCYVHDPQKKPTVIEDEGPDNRHGAFFYWTNAAQPEYVPTPGYHPDEQEWTPCKASGDLPAGRFWMGRQKGQPIEPASILRIGWLNGTLLELGDAQQWAIPAAPMIPQKIGLDERGIPSRQVDARYADYWDRVVSYYDSFLASEDISRWMNDDLDIAREWRFAVDTLAINYRVDAAIVDWLGLLDEQLIVQLILRTFHGDQIRLSEALKKKSTLKPEGPSTPASSSEGAGTSHVAGSAG